MNVRSKQSIVALYAAVTGLAVVWMIPLLTALMSSLRPQREIRGGWWNLAEATFSFGNYVEAWNKGLSAHFMNSLIITIFAVLVTVATGTMAAYALARLRFRMRRPSYFLLITTMIVPVQLILIPLLPWFKTLGFDQGSWLPYAGIVLVHAAFGAGWAVFMLTSFFNEIPDEVIEAAQIDGAGDFQIFRKVMLPLAIPGIVSFAIIDFIFVWNDLLLALTLLGRDFQPITVGLANLQSPHLSQDDIVSAGAIIAILPPLLLFAALNRYYVKGLFGGSSR